MDKRQLLYGAVTVAALFVLSGCETIPKKVKEEMLGMKSKMATLESRVETVETKQMEVERVSSEQTQALDAIRAQRESLHVRQARTNVSVKPRFAKNKAQIRELQMCLKNAGFYTGKIDGHKGKATKRAIKEFQKANGLRADGVVGPKTWEVLSKYSDGRAAQATPEEAATK